MATILELAELSAAAYGDPIPYAVTVDPSGKYVYVANYGSTGVSQYTIAAGGGLTPMASASVAAGTKPASVTTVGTWQ